MRGILKRVHPEGIPWPLSLLYGRLSATTVFRRHYELVAGDVRQYSPADRILDVGTGPGHLLLALHRALPNAALVGVDISPGMAALAERNVDRSGKGGVIEIREADAASLPFEDESFDIVVSTGSLHHWKAPLEGLSEAYRVLRRGGHALIYDLVRRVPRDVAGYMRSEFGTFRSTLLWLHSFEEPFMDAPEMEELAQRTDFDLEGTRFVGALCCLALLKKAG